MKIYLSIACLTLFLTTASNAQYVNLGIKGGFNLYTIKSDNNAQSKLKPGFNVGCLGHIHFTKHFALQPELWFSTQGYKYNLSSGDEGTLKLNYLNLPVLFQFMFNRGFRLQAGPQVGLLVFAKSKNNNNSINSKDNFNTIDFAITTGFSYVNPPTGFGGDLRYNFGVSNINKYGTVKSINSGLQLGIFYLLKHRS